MTPDVQGPLTLGTPAGVSIVAGVDHEEIHLERVRDPSLILFGIGALVLAGLAALYVSSAAFRGALGFFVVGGGIVAAAAGATIWKRLSKAPPEVVRISGAWLEAHGARVTWADVEAIDRTASGRGSGLLVRAGDGKQVGVGGHLRPSQADWLQHRLEAHWERALAEGEHDPDAQHAIEALRERRDT